MVGERELTRLGRSCGASDGARFGRGRLSATARGRQSSSGRSIAQARIKQNGKQVVDSVLGSKVESSVDRQPA